MLYDNPTALQRYPKMLHTHTSGTRKELLSKIESLTPRLDGEAHALSDSLLTTINTGVQAGYNTEQAIEQELRAVDRQLRQLAATTRNWQLLLRRLGTALKELGDVENWVSVICEDGKGIMRDVSEMP